MQGLREAGVDESDVNIWFQMLNTDDNYAAYRKMISEEGGIPFLIPHIRGSQRRRYDAPVELPSSFAAYSTEAILLEIHSQTEGNWLWRSAWRWVSSQVQMCFGICT